MGVLAQARRRVRQQIAELIAERIAELVDEGISFKDAVHLALVDFRDGRLTK